MPLFNEIRIVKWPHDATVIEIYDDGRPIKFFIVYEVDSEYPLSQGLKALITALEKETE